MFYKDMGEFYYNIIRKSCNWNVALYGSGIWTLGKNEERVVNAFEKLRWRKMLKKVDRQNNE